MKPARKPIADDSVKLLQSNIFRGTEDVFASRPDRIDGAPVRRFDAPTWDAMGVVPRRNNIQQYQLRITFPAHPAWNLRSREVAMALLNSSDPRLLARSVSYGSRQFSIGHVRSRCEAYKTVATWQHSRALPDDLIAWSSRDWSALIDAEIARGAKRGTIRNLVNAIRDLVVLGPILTGGGLDADPWKGKSTAAIAAKAVGGTSAVIAPERWIPLIQACWTYIDVFAEDILSLRDSHDCQLRVGMPEWRQRLMVSDDALLEAYLTAEGTVIPIANGSTAAPEPRWNALSRLVTADRVTGIFKRDRQNGRTRRQRVFDAIASGSIPCEVMDRRRLRTLLDKRIADSSEGNDPRTNARITRADMVLDEWIARPDTLVVIAETPVGGAQVIAERDVNWARMERIIFEQRPLAGLLGTQTAVGKRRRQKVLDTARAGRYWVATRGVGALRTERECTGFTMIDDANGGRRPWRDSISDFEARCELRALRASCYVFVAAMTMMRDSEIQDIQRNSLGTVHGVAAVRSNLYKGRSGKVGAHWWIIDDVATAIRMLERLSVHPDWLFARFVDGDLEDLEPGINARREINFLLEHLAKTGQHSGLDPVPDGTAISPRNLRRTTACLSRELGGNELAVSHQLKHVINFGYSNVTAKYMAPDPEWAKLLHTNRTEQALERMVAMVQDSSRNTEPLAGRGGARLAESMNSSSSPAPNGRQLATVLSDAQLASLLKKMAPEIHFGPANACLYDARTALCRQQATTETHGPLLGWCQPARCPNSVVGPEHLPVWISELNALKSTLAGHRVSPPRRQALSERLVDVENVLQQARTDSRDVRQ